MVAHANGRIPGATGLAIHPRDDRQMLLGLSFGLALTRDGGASWTWMCEQQIEGNGSDIDPSIVMTDNGSLVVLSLTNGGVLVSRDDGCSFERAMGPLQGNRGVDLTLDPSQPGRVLALMSTIVEVLEGGVPRYRNLLAHSLDHGGSWTILAELPDDMLAETIELAPSEPTRIYISGTANADPLQGIVMRSDDGGQTWKRSSVRLPKGSGSLFISGIHPTDPDRLWFRVPGRGDFFGIIQARLWLSTDAATSFHPVAETSAGMLGFALSPDGESIAFGGPLDGLFVAPADASAEPTKVSDLQVHCLRWHSSGLYACGAEPTDPYSLGYAADPTQAFVPLWHRANMCMGACAAPSPLAMHCQQPWETIAPLVGAESEVCEASPPLPDAGVDAGSSQPIIAADSGTEVTAPARGCSVSFPGRAGTPWWLSLLLMFAATRTRSARKVTRAKIPSRG